MNNPETLRALADRVMRLEGPCRETEGAIWCALFGETEIIIGDDGGRFPAKAVYGPARKIAHISGFADYVNAPKCTASLDVAKSLVPEGYDLTVGTEDGRGWADVMPKTTPYPFSLEFDANAATPENALTAAALLARAAMMETPNDQ